MGVFKGLMNQIATSASLRTALREAFVRNLPVSSGTEEHLAGALQAALRNPGSMFRAELAFRIARSYGESRERAEELAIALEYFHTASLLFDDLPAMDNAAERRGAPCVHRLYGEGAAMLAALALINRAYALVWAAAAGLPAAQQQRALRYLEANLGLEGLLNGQSQDLHYAELPGSPSAPDRVAMGKTVSLIRLSLVLPALVSGAPAGEIRRLECLAVYWGLGYQTIDDLKDVMLPSSESGKTGDRDARLNRPNQALFCGVAEAFTRAQRLMGLASRVTGRLVRQRAALSFLSEAHAHFEQEMLALAHVSPALSQ
jgi:geranylgeranyl diphosphate synthase type II